MAEKSSYAEKVGHILERIDGYIEEMKKAGENAPSEEKSSYDEAISFLIANREATRRGLLQPETGNVDPCEVCPYVTGGGRQ